MAVISASLQKESRDRYLTYALSVVSGRALPDVRDGLKPVQRRILFSMLHNLGLRPSGAHRKSATVIGDVLGKYHPHGDAACYEAMVRMAQDFSLRYPLVDGQGNFGSLDGDNAAAYRYTEAKLREIALDVIGEIDEETVPFRDNFDASTLEPVVFPSRVPNLLINGASGIAVGMATSIPPHNLKDTVKALIELSKDSEISVQKLTTIVKGPDFPTGCLILNSKKELEDLYATGRGSIRMRSEWKTEDLPRGKKAIVITSIPFAVNKAQVVERIGMLIADRKVPQLVDVKDESTEDVRIVLELAPGAEAELAIAYLFKHTPLDSNFPVNMTVLVPSESGATRPEVLSLKECLRHFLIFREEVTEKKLLFEKKNLLARIHILEGLAIIFDALDEALTIIRKSEGRGDAAEKLQKRFKLTETQSFAVVDMRVYQLSRTNITEVKSELKEKNARVKEINRLLGDKEEIRKIIREDLEKLADKYGDKRRSPLIREAVELEFNADAYVVEEDIYAIVTADGWVKRIRQNNELSGTRVREGDTVLHAHAISTKDSVAFFTNMGNVYSLKGADFPASSGFGSPVQKLLKFKDEEKIIESFVIKEDGGVSDGTKVLLVTQGGVGSALTLNGLTTLKRNGKRVAKLKEGDFLSVVIVLPDEVVLTTRKGYGVRLSKSEIPARDGASVGVSLMSVRDGDAIVAALGKPKSGKVVLELSSGRTKEISWGEIPKSHRALKGEKLISQGEIVGIKEE